jgi:signal transduction histidine kinase
MMNDGDLVLPPNPWWLRSPALLPNLASGVAVLAAVVEIVRAFAAIAGAFPVLGVLLGVVGVGVTRRYAWPGLLLAVVGCAVAAVQQWDPIVEWTIVVFVLFSLTVRGTAPVRMILVTALPVYVVVAVESGAGMVSPDALAAVAACIAAGAAGAAIWSQQRYWSTLREHAREAIASRDVEARRRVDAERLRIARDLHDVVGHQIAVASMHLGAVEVTVGRDPSTAARAAGDAREALRMVTAETQQILELLRARDSAPDQTVAGLGSLPALFSSFGSIGLEVVPDVVLPDESVAPVIDVTVYRIVQEALTNAHRYGTGTVAITVRAEHGRLHVVSDNPRSAGTTEAHGSGFGLVGMRERVAAAGGTLDIEEHPDRFVVHAVLALDGRKLS